MPKETRVLTTAIKDAATQLWGDSPSTNPEKWSDAIWMGSEECQASFDPLDIPKDQALADNVQFLTSQLQIAIDFARACGVEVHMHLVTFDHLPGEQVQVKNIYRKLI